MRILNYEIMKYYVLRMVRTPQKKTYELNHII